MSRAWFKRLIPRAAASPLTGVSGPSTRVVDVELYRGGTGGKDWTAEWRLLDEQMTEEITTDDLGALVEYVLADACVHVGEHLDVAMQWSLRHDDPQQGTDVTGSELDGVILPVTLHT
ncbi:hypothetical protein K7711_09780 [Nocardia sp. CA2R105]|uniref:hypothetical protein n=1 Tax=Nocardia coffeae TaxID=2873381 RepID=UPI001CA79EC9|nr:hypothetical protein [Nocardia coffeae]MBY8856765.1 hypothetical protein [Nocardia coffeae]